MAYTLINLSQEEETRESSYWVLWLLAILVILIVCFFRWGGYLPIAGDSVPQHVDAAVVLQGSVANENARTDAAMELLQRGTADRVAISVPRESRWGQEIPSIARPYLEKKYGPELTGKVEFCATDLDMTSPRQEAQALGACFHEHGWKSVALLTSNYESRRVGLVWRKTLSSSDAPVSIAVQGLPESAYQPRGWWRQRLYAETWVRESVKLAWASL